MFHIASTRFNEFTWDENLKYRLKCRIPVMYGIDLKIRNKYPPGGWLFVIEMNNELNQIEGIGLIQNLLVHDKHKIYNNYTYNFYIYKGNHWFSRTQIGDIDEDIIKICDTILFKGKSHLKRQSGISILTETLFKNWPDYSLNVLKRKIHNLLVQSLKENNQYCRK